MTNLEPITREEVDENLKGFEDYRIQSFKVFLECQACKAEFEIMVDDYYLGESTVNGDWNVIKKKTPIVDFAVCQSHDREIPCINKTQHLKKLLIGIEKL